MKEDANKTTARRAKPERKLMAQKGYRYSDGVTSGFASRY